MEGVVPNPRSPFWQRNDFETEMGILLPLDPEKVELNNKIIIFDLKVDLGLIYPKETRERIARKENQEYLSGKIKPRYQLKLRK